MLLHINKSSELDISEKFIDLESSLEGANYVVVLEAVEFESKSFQMFDMHDLKFLWRDVDFVDGKIVKSSFDEAVSDINVALSYFSIDKKIEKGFQANKNKIINIRKIKYWDIVSQSFHLPPEIVYKQEPASGSYFDDFYMWGFCYIFFNNNKGIVLSGRSFD